MSHPSQNSEVDAADNGNDDDSSKGRESSRQTSRRSRSGSPHVTDSSISLYKTEPCQSFSETGYCRYGLKCRFAHGQADIRPLARHKKYKTERCKTYAKSGFCPYGARCRFVHEESERETSRTASPAPHGVESSPFLAPTNASGPSPALSPYTAPSAASPALPPAAAQASIPASPAPRRESVTESLPVHNVLPPPQVVAHHVPVRRPGSPALTPIGTPVNKPTVGDMRPFDAFHSMSLSTGQDETRSLRSYAFRGSHVLRPSDGESLFSDFGGPGPVGPRSLSVPADHRSSSMLGYVGGVQDSSPLHPPDLTRGLSLSVGHHPLDPPKEDPPNLAIPSSILDSMTNKPLPLNTSYGDSKDDYIRPTPRNAVNRSRSFDTSDNYNCRNWSHSQEEELASCSSILSHLELHNDSQPLSPSTVEPPEARFKQLPPLYPKRQSFCYDDIATLPTTTTSLAGVDGRYDPRPKTPDLKQAANMNSMSSIPLKSSPPYKPHGSPQVQGSPMKLASTPPPHGRASRARVSTSSSPSQPRSPLVVHHLNSEPGQFESLGRSKTDPRAPSAKKDVRLSAFAAPFSNPGSPASAPSSRASPSVGFPARSLFTSTSSNTPRFDPSPIVMHLTPDYSLEADSESTVLSLLSSATTAPSTTSNPSPSGRNSPALSPFPLPFFPKSPKYPSQQKRGNLRKPE